MFYMSVDSQSHRSIMPYLEASITCDAGDTPSPIAPVTTLHGLLIPKVIVCPLEAGITCDASDTPSPLI